MYTIKALRISITVVLALALVLATLAISKDALEKKE